MERTELTLEMQRDLYDYDAAMEVFALRRQTIGGPLARRVERLIDFQELKDKLLDDAAKLLWEVVYRAIEQPEWAGQTPPNPIDPNTLAEIRRFLAKLTPRTLPAV